MTLQAKDHRLETIHKRLDAALELRVRLHQERAADKIDVRTYSEGLRQVRHIEDECEDIRRRAGRTVSRAVELCAAEGHEASVRLVIKRETERHGSAPDPQAVILASLSDRERQLLLQGKSPHALGAGSSGPCRAAIDWTSKSVTVEAFTAAEWAQEVGYHAYWTAHGYNTLDEQLKADSPPNPPRVARKVTFTFARLRKLIEAESAEQLAIGERHCEWCDGQVAEDAGPCPYSFECPTCGAKPGSKCKRPSGHEAAEVHRARIDLEHAAKDAERTPAPSLPPLAAQIDLDGNAHEIAPHTVQEQLFTPAPTQLPGQTRLDA